MNGNLFDWNNTWGSGTPPAAWTGNSVGVSGHMGSVRAQYNLKLVNPQYPQNGNSNLTCPINLTPGSVTSSPNTNPYNVTPLTTIGYKIN